MPKAARIQAELTYSAVALGGLLPRRPGSLVLDLGAGGGLSTLTFQALAHGSGSPVPYILAFDSSAHMLATTTEESSLLGIRLPAVKDRAISQVDTESVLLDASASEKVDLSSGLPWLSRRDRVLADMSQPLPLRSGIADAILSVSAVQWLVEPRQSGQESQASQAKLQTLFSSLRQVAVEHGKLAMQFYPPKGDHDFGARALRNAARKQLWSQADIVMDFPHHPSSVAKKWFLIADARDAPSPIRKAEGWCALCWPVVVGRCALQGTCAAVQQDRAKQQHLEVASRLARCGRRLRPPLDDQQMKIQQHVRQQLHPLQIELAKSLDQAVQTKIEDSASEVAEPNTSSETQCEMQGCKRPRHDGSETKTELRSIVSSCLPELIGVLHTPPSEEWLRPPPPFDPLGAGISEL